VSEAFDEHPATRPTPKILIVDDVPMFRELERLFLGRMGEVRTVASATDALAALEQDPADVVVLDLHLPDQDGVEVCRAIRARSEWRHAAIVAISGGQGTDHARAIRAGASDVISKPLSRHSLVHAVGRFLREGDAPPVGLPRVRHATPVDYWNDDRRAHGVIRNLSRGGIFIEGDWLPPDGAEMQLSFDLPGAPAPFSPTGQVVWRRGATPENGGAGVGLRFLSLEGGASRDLEHFVHEHLGPRFHWSAEGG
jgi:uncharacterized protein (TIGR02266 family)